MLDHLNYILKNLSSANIRQKLESAKSLEEINTIIKPFLLAAILYCWLIGGGYCLVKFAIP